MSATYNARSTISHDELTSQSMILAQITFSKTDCADENHVRQETEHALIHFKMVLWETMRF